MRDNYNLQDESSQENRDGFVEIQEGSIEVTNPKGSGKPALLIPQEGVELEINGKHVKDKGQVNSEDDIKLKELTYTTPPEITVKISKDKLYAELEVTPEKKIHYKLTDQTPKNTVYLKVDKNEFSTGKYPSREEIVLELKKNGVIYGIDTEILEQFARGEVTQGTIAAGVLPHEGTDGYVEFLFEKDIKKIEHESEEKGKIDYRERFHIPQVSEGDTLAIIYDPVEGTSGKNILGEEIPPKPIKEVNVRCGDGVTLEENKVIATSNGRPLLKKGKNPFISVEPIYVHKGNVDMQSGNLRFQGHVKIEGEINEGMTIKAEGDLEVLNNAAGSNVITGGNATFSRNLINCNVKAGGLHILCQELNQHLEKLCDMVGSTLSAVRQLIKALKERGEQAENNFTVYTQTLLTTKFPDIPDTLQTIRNMLEKAEFSPPDSVLKRINEADRFFLGEEWKKSKDASSFAKIYKSIQEASNTLASLSTSPSSITSYYVQNSYLKCTGDIHVTGPGSYNSQFECGGKVYIHRLFRGGTIFAEDDVAIGEAGTPGSMLSQGIIQVPKEKSIFIKKVHEGTRIKIGERIHRFDDIEYNVKAKLDHEDNRIKIKYQH